MNKEEFIDKIIANVKYRSVHRYIREELSSHIDEAAEYYEKDGYDHKAALQKAVNDIGDIQMLGAAFNKVYRLPFNSRYGLGIWSCIVTCVIYLLIYPLIMTLKSAAFSAAAVILFTSANYAVLRRGHLVASLPDVRDILTGFFCGAAVSLVILFGWSLFNNFGYYPYAENIEILFFRPVNYWGGELRMPGDELLILILYAAIYLISCKVNTRAKGFNFVIGLDSVYPYYVNTENEP